MDEATIARFWSKVDKSAGLDGCWIWTGSTVPGPSSGRYGRFSVRCPTGTMSMLAHRFAFQTTTAPIPAGLVLMHSCDTPACCNPAHLSTGTQSDNARDSAEKGRRYPSGWRRRRSDADREAVLSMIGAGLSKKRTAEAIGCSRRFVALVLKAQGCD